MEHFEEWGQEVLVKVLDVHSNTETHFVAAEALLAAVVGASPLHSAMPGRSRQPSW